MQCRKFFRIFADMKLRFLFVALCLGCVAQSFSQVSVVKTDVGEQFTVNGVPFDMIYVEGGSFQMGADTWLQSRPIHAESVGSFSLGKSEVTQALWEAVMGSNPSNFKGENLPVESITLKQCKEFINKLNELTGRNFRLPTEAEWEYAARGGKHAGNYRYSGGNEVDNLAWHDANSGNTTHPVGSKFPNALGLYDMSGNVEEMTSTPWSDDYKSAKDQSRLVARGGGWNNTNAGCDVFCRSWYEADYFIGSYSRGLRLAL